jgi:hypothetical protein
VLLGGGGYWLFLYHSHELGYDFDAVVIIVNKFCQHNIEPVLLLSLLHF